jgi:hypothetical protein
LILTLFVISVKLTSVPLGCPPSMESTSSTMMLGSVSGFRLLTETYLGQHTGVSGHLRVQYMITVNDGLLETPV